MDRVSENAADNTLTGCPGTPAGSHYRTTAGGVRVAASDTAAREERQLCAAAENRVNAGERHPRNDDPPPRCFLIPTN